MKKQLLFISASLLLATGTFAQAQKTISSETYDALKKNGQLSGDYRIQDNAGAQVSTIIHPPVDQIDSAGTGCSCMIPLDSSFSYVPFSGYTSPYQNDDASALINLPFSFSLYGTSYNSVYINNNGNVSFGTSYATFSASGFPNNSFVMIAPFWADVDTRGVNSGLVYYKLTTDYLIVKWDNVGYYSMHDDKTNNFQLIISTGADSLLPGTNNVAFCYGDMQWTTGDASQGVNGFGGTPTTVGVNKGDGINFAQLTRNDSTGISYDGPNGLSDGVDWLDNRSFYLDVSSLSTAPIAYDSLCDTLIPVFDSIGNPFRVFFNSLDANENISINILNQPAGMFMNTSNLGNTTELSFRFYPVSTGLQNLTISYTDDGHPGVSYNYSRTFDVLSASSAVGLISQKTENTKMYPNPAKNEIFIDFNNKQGGFASISDISGRKIASFQLSENKNSIPLNGIAPGVYFISIGTQDGINEIKKLIIE